MVKKLENEVEIHAVDLRYQLMDKDVNEDEDDITDEEKEEICKEKERGKNKYKGSTIVMDTEKGNLDMTILKVINLSKNYRPHEPREAINDEELNIQTQNQEIQKRSKETIKNLDTKGDLSN